MKKEFEGPVPLEQPEGGEEKIDVETLRQRFAERFPDLDIDPSVLSERELEVFHRLEHDGVPRADFDGLRAEITQESMKRKERGEVEGVDPLIKFVAAISQAARMDEEGIYRFIKQK